MMRPELFRRVILALCCLLIIPRPTTAGKESMSDRMKRIEFVREMERLEKETLRKKSQKSLQERLLKVAQEIVPESIFGPKEQRDLGNYKDDDYLSNYVYANDADIDLAGYALKYVGCQNVHTWDDNLAGASSPLAMKRFVMFRLCKANDCSAYNKWGCNYNYGEYVIPMEDYLAIMAEYHFEQFGRFCKTCYRCMHLDYYKDDETYTNTTDDDTTGGGYKNDDGGRCDLNDDGCTDDEYWAEYRRYWGERKLDNYNYNQGNGAANYYYNNGGGGGGDDAYNLDDDYYNNDVNKYPWYADQYGKCIFEDICSNYRSVCRKFDPDATNYESYFTCSSFNFGGFKGYLGPHCRSDGRTIGIGMYNDGYCNDFFGEASDIAEASGISFDDGDLKNYYNKDCISCSAEESYSLISDDVLGSGEDLTYPLCSLAYQVSGKCDKYLSASIASSSANYYQYANQEANEQAVCTFIENLVEHNYNEQGEIVLWKHFNAENWQNPGEYVNIAREATPFQKLALTVSMLLFLGLFGYAIYLTKKLVYRKPWRPPHSVNSPYMGGADSQSLAAVSQAGRLSRAYSGVVQLRSMSAEATSVYNENAYSAHSQLV